MRPGSARSDRWRLWMAFVALSVCLLPSAAPAETARDEETLVRRAHYVMGTIFEITAFGQDRAAAVEAVQAAFAAIRRADRLMSHYRPESELMRLNHRADAEEVGVSRALYQVLEDSQRFAELSGGAFDITVSPLVELWRKAAERNRLPRPGELKQARQRTGFANLALRPGRRVRFLQPKMRLNLGAIGKGWAVDRALEELRARGVSNAFISAGTSTIYALGEGPQGQGWSVSVRDPRDPGTTLREVRLCNEALATSASYERFYEIQGRRYSHIIDPRTGRPVQPMLNATVVAAAAAEADALSTAVFVMGMDEGAQLLRRQQRPGLLVGEDDATDEPVVRLVEPAALAGSCDSSRAVQARAIDR